MVVKQTGCLSGKRGISTLSGTSVDTVLRRLLFLNHLIRCSDTKGVNVFMSFVVFYKTVIHLLVYALDNQVRLSNRICYY